VAAKADWRYACIFCCIACFAPLPALRAARGACARGVARRQRRRRIGHLGSVNGNRAKNQRKLGRLAATAAWRKSAAWHRQAMAAGEKDGVMALCGISGAAP
jgi:hypothetical protein